jgi:hypothetical protein
MIVITRRIGRLANRLWLFAHFIACVRENSVLLVNPSFGEYAQHFRGTAGDLLCRYPPRKSFPRPQPWARRLLYRLTYLPTRLLIHLRCVRWPLRIIRLSYQEGYDLASADFRDLLNHRRIVLVQGWGFRNQHLLWKHADAIREFFRPLPEHEEKARRVVEEARRGADVLVGIHARQGDYARFLNGKYFYSTAQYRAVMQRVERLFAPRRVSFLLCSDSPQPVDSCRGLHVVRGPGHAVEDVCALALCDYLVGPPSTYTDWASFYGQTPLCRLVSPDMAIHWDSFAVDAYQAAPRPSEELVA